MLVGGRFMRVRLLAVLVLCVATAASAADTVLVEDWSQLPVGAKGMPAGWQKQSWGSPKYDFTVVAFEGGKALQMRSANEGSTISKEIKGKVDLKATPILEWTWKATVLPKGGNSCKKATDDQAAQIFV